MMSALSIFAVFAGVVQLTVPSYALRLVRRWGTQRVGWFLASAFTLLALIHLSFQPSGYFVRDIILVSASAILLGSMIWVEKLCVRLRRVEDQEQQTLNAYQQKNSEHTRLQIMEREHWTQQIAERDEEIAQLREAGEQYRTIFQESPQALWAFDLRTLRVLASNRSAQRMLGYPGHELMGMNAQQLMAEESLQAFLGDVTRPCSGAERRGRFRMVRRDGAQLLVEITVSDLMFCGSPARIVLTTDAMERHVQDVQLVKQERQQEFSRLTLALSRHLSPMLARVDEHVSSVMAECTDDTSMARLMEILATANRASNFQRQLLTAAGEVDCYLQSLDLNHWLEKQAAGLRSFLGKGTALRLQLDSELPLVPADPKQLQVLINQVINNARDAMPAGGTVYLTTGEVKISENDLPPGPNAGPGRYALLSIRDSGGGIPPEIQSRTFEPFFTTKQNCVGLGLAMMQGVAMAHRGWVECSSHPSTGTEFRVLLPFAPHGTSANQAV